METTTLVPNYFADFSQNHEEIEQNKNVLRNHPLFPVISYLQYEIDHYQDGIGQVPDGEKKVEEKVKGFIAEFMEEMRKSSTPHTSDPEVDGFVLNAIRRLRFDLMELQEVGKFANRFVSKYQNDLDQTKEQYSNINEDERESSSASPPKRRRTEAIVNMEQAHEGHRSNNQEFMPPSVDDSRTHSDFDNSMASGHSHVNPYDMKNSPSSSIEDGRSSVASSTDTTESKKNFSKETVRILELWLHQHLERPYPTEPEKEELSQRTGISKTQVNNWFINVRRRKVPGLLNRGNKQAEPMKSTINDANNNKAPPQFAPFTGIFPNPMFPMYPGNPTGNQMGQHMGQFPPMPFPGTPMFPPGGFNSMQFPNMMGGPMGNFNQTRPTVPLDCPPHPGQAVATPQPVQSPFSVRDGHSPFHGTPPMDGNNAPMIMNGPMQMQFQNMNQFWGNQKF